MSKLPASKIVYPEWVNKGRGKQVRASNRVRYIINRLAAEVGPKNSIRAIADAIKMDYSTLCVYMIRGYFSPRTADKLEKCFGPDWAPSHILQDPLAE